jgi:hypothetical protein
MDGLFLIDPQFAVKAGRQRSESRRQKAEGRRQEAGGRRQEAGGRSQKWDNNC